jgi:plastocyanin
MKIMDKPGSFHQYKWLVLTICFISVLTITKCRKYDAFPPTNSAQPANEVDLQNTSFNPAELTVSVGTTVRWVNKDAVPHTVTSDQGLFDSGNMNPNDVYEFRFNNAGTYSYHCNYHLPYMVGKIIVQ